jgi:hypothetical protein
LPQNATRIAPEKKARQLSPVRLENFNNCRVQ